MERESCENVKKINDLKIESDKLRESCELKSTKMQELETTIKQLRMITVRYKQLLADNHKSTTTVEPIEPKASSNTLVDKSINCDPFEDRSNEVQKLKDQLISTDKDLNECRLAIEAFKSSESNLKITLKKSCTLLLLSRQYIQSLNKQNSNAPSNKEINTSLKVDNKNPDNKNENAYQPYQIENYKSSISTDLKSLELTNNQSNSSSVVQSCSISSSPFEINEYNSVTNNSTNQTSIKPFFNPRKTQTMLTIDSMNTADDIEYCESSDSQSTNNNCSTRSSKVSRIRPIIMCSSRNNEEDPINNHPNDQDSLVNASSSSKPMDEVESDISNITCPIDQSKSQTLVDDSICSHTDGTDSKTKPVDNVRNTDQLDNSDKNVHMLNDDDHTTTDNDYFDNNNEQEPSCNQEYTDKLDYKPDNPDILLQSEFSMATTDFIKEYSNFETNDLASCSFETNKTTCSETIDESKNNFSNQSIETPCIVKVADAVFAEAADTVVASVELDDDRSKVDDNSLTAIPSNQIGTTDVNYGDHTNQDDLKKNVD